MEKVVLFDHRSERININVMALFEPDGALRIDGCDSGPRVKEMWGDFDYEYIITVKPADVPSVIAALETTKAKLLETLAEQFSGEKAYSRFKTFLESRAIAFDVFTWA